MWYAKRFVKIEMPAQSLRWSVMYVEIDRTHDRSYDAREELYYR